MCVVYSHEDTPWNVFPSSGNFIYIQFPLKCYPWLILTAKMSREHQASLSICYFEATAKRCGNGFIYLQILPKKKSNGD